MQFAELIAFLRIILIIVTNLKNQKTDHMNFIDELRWRGMIQDMTPGLEEYLETNKLKGYIGFDPTAPSLTIGNYVQIMKLNLFQRAGHTPVVLMGGATGRIGDPSFKESERELKSDEEIQRNLEHQKNQFKKLLNFEEGENRALMFNNYDFYKDMNVLDFLRDVGKTLTVNYMMSKDSVKSRLETGLSFTEFSYQLIQGYDFQLLLEEHNVELQMGGSDQWGNITSGTEFIRRNTNRKAYALTSPLLVKADGTKFGKSESGNIWLDPQMTSPYQFYQFWINADDRDIEKFIKTFSLKPVRELQSWLSEEKDPRNLKRELAEELTRRLHGDDEFDAVLKVSELLFNNRAGEDFVHSLTEADLQSIVREIPTIDVDPAKVEDSTSLLALTVGKDRIFASNGEARRAIQNNAVSVNKVKVADFEHNISKDQWLYDRYLLVENGRKNKFALTIKK